MNRKNWRQNKPRKEGVLIIDSIDWIVEETQKVEPMTGYMEHMRNTMLETLGIPDGIAMNSYRGNVLSRTQAIQQEANERFQMRATQMHERMERALRDMQIYGEAFLDTETGQIVTPNEMEEE